MSNFQLTGRMSWLCSIGRICVLALTLCGTNAPDVFAEPAKPAIQVPDSDVIQRLELQDGSIFYGRVEEAGDPLRFRLASGIEIDVPLRDVLHLENARGEMRDGRYRSADPNRTRLFFGPTARTLPKGSGYLSVFELVIPFVSYSPNDRLILSGGTPLFFGGDEGDRILWFTPKWRLAGTKDTDFAVGVLAFTTLGGAGSAGILYGVGTRGTDEHSLSLGVGYGFIDGALASHPAVMLGGEQELARHIKLISENYLLPGGPMLLSLGPRFYGDHFSVDLGLLLPIDSGQIDFALPLFNLVWNW